MKKYIFAIAIVTGILLQLVAGNALHSQGIVLVPDTIDLTPLIPKTVNILANDTIPTGDSIKIISAGSIYVYGVVNPDETVTFTANPQGSYWGIPTLEPGVYRLQDLTLDTMITGILVFHIRDYSYDSLYLNNINARFSADGLHFNGPSPEWDHGAFEVPKFTGKHTIYLSTFWMGGLYQDSVLHLAAQTYGQGPTIGTPHTHFDFWAGPVMDSDAYSIDQDTLWNYVWNLTKLEIEYHKSHWFVPGYAPIHDILTWPGNGDVSLGQAAQLAPYYDRNNDGIYNPMDGDYPLIRGDQALFFIFNDDRNNHSETDGNKLKVEVHGMAYAFNLPDDSAFNNTVFLDYKIINRSDKIYYNTYFGVFTDLDIGWYLDDYIGCDVERGMYYGYNGNPIDGSGQSWAYGANPPAQSVTFLGGPLMDPDGIDNPKFDNQGHPLCNESIDGLNFGDSIVDNERLGMSRFLYYNNNGNIQGNPTLAIDFYNYMRGILLNGDSTKSRFSFNGQSDTLNWGTGCTLTAYSHTSEVTAQNAPGDRRGIGSSGPFTFNPGQVEELDVAYTFARDYTGSHPGGSIGVLQERTDSIRKHFISNVLPGGNSFNGIDQRKSGSEMQIQIFPNPTYGILNIRFNIVLNDAVNIRIINSSGTVIRTETRKPSDRMITLDITGLSAGLYFISIETKNQVVTKKVSIIQ